MPTREIPFVDKESFVIRVFRDKRLSMLASLLRSHSCQAEVGALLGCGSLPEDRSRYVLLDDIVSPSTLSHHYF